VLILPTRLEVCGEAEHVEAGASAETHGTQSALAHGDGHGNDARPGSRQIGAHLDRRENAEIDERLLGFEEIGAAVDLARLDVERRANGALRDFLETPKRDGTVA